MIYPIRTIVAGVGDLDRDDIVLAEGIELARRLGATLHLVHAHDMPPLLREAYASIGQAAPENFESRYNADVRTRLEEVASTHGDLKDVVFHVVAAPPAEAMRQVAGDANADLILVGATRRGRAGRLLLGTTAQRVLRGTSLPVLIVRHPLAARSGRVLVASDLSELSGNVHELGLDVIEAISAGSGPATQIRSLVVVAPLPLPPPLRADEVRQIALQHLETANSRLRSRGPQLQAVARIGEPADEIAREAEEWGADYVVVGTHSRKGLERALAGSVAESTVRTISSSNVLVIPAGTEARTRAAG